MTQALPATGAEDVRWRLDELYDSPEDPAIDRTLAEALDFAREFEETYRGRIAQLAPAEFAAMMEDLERHLTSSSRPLMPARLTWASRENCRRTGARNSKKKMSTPTS